MAPAMVLVDGWFVCKDVWCWLLSLRLRSLSGSVRYSGVIPGGGDLEIFIRDGVTKDMVCLILMS